MQYSYKMGTEKAREALKKGGLVEEELCLQQEAHNKDRTRSSS